MAAIDFPASPTNGQLFSPSNGGTYQWNGTFWLPIGNTTATIWVGDTPPASPIANQFWFNSALGQTFIWYNDGSTTQWVPANPTTVLTQPGTGDFCAYSTLASIAAAATVVVTGYTVGLGNAGGWLNTVNGRYIPPAGRYVLQGYMQTYSSASLIIAASGLRKNGVDIPGANFTSTSPALNNRCETSVSAIVDANGTDYFELTAYAHVTSAATQVSFMAFPLGGIKGPPGDPGTVDGGKYIRCLFATNTVGAVGAFTTAIITQTHNDTGTALVGNTWTPPAGRWHVNWVFNVGSAGINGILLAGPSLAGAAPSTMAVYNVPVGNFEGSLSGSDIIDFNGSTTLSFQYFFSGAANYGTRGACWTAHRIR